MISSVSCRPSLTYPQIDKFLETQLSKFYDSSHHGGFFSTPLHAPHVILRLKDGMDTSEPSTNGTSASNLYRLSSLLNDSSYAAKAAETVHGFESETLQYPWLFGSFMPSIVAGKLGLKGVVVSMGEGESGEKRIKEFEKAPRGGLGTFICLSGKDGENKWLRSRNELLKDFGKDGKTRVMTCENGTCSEERDPEHLAIADMKEALPDSNGLGKGKEREGEVGMDEVEKESTQP